MARSSGWPSRRGRRCSDVAIPEKQGASSEQPIQRSAHRKRTKARSGLLQRGISEVNRSQLAHIVRAASRIVDAQDMLIIGSQSILGAFEEYQLPNIAMLSREADVTFFDDPDDRKSDRVDGAIGEMSDFDQEFGIYAQGVSVSTAVLPDGWRERVIAFENAETEGAIAWCLEPHESVEALRESREGPGVRHRIAGRGSHIDRHPSTEGAGPPPPWNDPSSHHEVA